MGFLRNDDANDGGDDGDGVTYFQHLMMSKLTFASDDLEHLRAHPSFN